LLLVLEFIFRTGTSLQTNAGANNGDSGLSWSQYGKTGQLTAIQCPCT
jgi:hypothetical protein